MLLVVALRASRSERLVLPSLPSTRNASRGRAPGPTQAPSSPSTNLARLPSVTVAAPGATETLAVGSCSTVRVCDRFWTVRPPLLATVLLMKMWLSAVRADCSAVNACCGTLTLNES